MTLKHFFNNVRIRLGHYDWSIRFVYGSDEGYCWKNRKIIDIGLNASNPKQLILHEIAHIDTCRFCNQKHNPAFWKNFRDLMRRFLFNEEICSSELNHMQYMSKGYYKVCYD